MLAPAVDGPVRGPITGCERSRLVAVDNLKVLLVAWVIDGHALPGYSAVGGRPYDEVNEVTFEPHVEAVLAAVLDPSGTTSRRGGRSRTASRCRTPGRCGPWRSCCCSPSHTR